LGAKAGTNGVGIDLSVGLTKITNARLSAAALDFEDSNESITVGDDGMESDASDELDDFDFWPVLAIGINYAF